MSEQGKKEILADILEVEVADIREDKMLEEFESWDSVAVLSVIAAVQENSGKYLHADDITKLKTVGDVLELLV